MKKGARELEGERKNDEKARDLEEMRDTAAADEYAGDETGWAGVLENGDAGEDAPVAASPASEVEELLIQRLTQDDAESANPHEAAVRALPPKWEIRIQTQYDPVAEETKIYRSMAREVDDRYGKDE